MAQGFFDVEKASKAAKDYAVSTGVECLLLLLDEGRLINPAEGIIHNQLCYCLDGDVANCCFQTHYEGTLKSVIEGEEQTYFCPMGLMHWAKPIIRGGHIVAAFIAGHTWMNRNKSKMEPSKEVSGKHNKLLEDYPALKETLLKSEVIDEDRLAGLTNMLEMVARSFSDDSYDETVASPEWEDFCRNSVKEPDKGIPWRELLEAVREKDKEAVKIRLQHVITALGAVGNVNTAKAAMTALILNLYDISLDKDGQCFLYNQCSNALHDLNQFRDLDEVVQWAEQRLMSLLGAVTLIPGIKNADMIFSAIQYIEDHYAENFSLQDISDHVHFSAPYFSKVFKREMNVTFTRYLTAFRIEKSKELLKNSSYSLGEIPSLVGFEEQSYFTRVFRSATGESPGRYRNRYTG